MAASRYYFAYGSNLNQAQMRLRCATAQFVCGARLLNYKFVITTNGWASIVPTPSSVVYGSVYALSPSDEAALDLYEGVANKEYWKTVVECLAAKRVPGAREAVGEEKGNFVLDCLTYIDYVAEEGRPNEEYIPRMNLAIADGMESAQIPDWYVKEAMRKFIPDSPDGKDLPESAFVKASVPAQGQEKAV